MAETESEDDLKALLKFLYMVPVGVVQTTLDGEITIINPMAANLLMPMQADSQLTNLFSALEQSVPGVRKLVDDHVLASGMICKSHRFNPFYQARRNSDQKTYELTLLKVDPKTLMAVLSDVTDTVKREEQIRLGAAWYNALLNERLNYGVVDLDENGLVLNWNSSVEKLTGFTASQIVGTSCDALFVDESNFSKRLPDLLYEASESGWTLQNDWCATAGGLRFWCNYIISASDANTAGADGKRAPTAKSAAYVLLLRDISEHAEASSKMLHATKSDHLTGILNRRAFFDLAEIEIKRWARTPRSLCLLAIDADYFKAINDSFGHGVGDTVLQALATAIQASVRQTDVTARIGGEEFAVMLPHTELSDAQDLAERVRRSVEALAINVEGHTLNLTVSIGIAQMSKETNTIAGLMKAADRALYIAKNAGRNRVETA